MNHKPSLLALRLGFEQPQYEVLEENRVVNNLIYITKNGMESEQTLRFLVENSQGSAVRGMFLQCSIPTHPSIIYVIIIMTENVFKTTSVSDKSCCHKRL